MSVARASAYKKKTLLEHVLLRAETYVGSKEPETVTLYIPETVGEKGRVQMTVKDVTFVPAFFKIFDEIIVNAADNKVRDGTTDTIKVTIDAESGEISVWNNGKGIPVVIHEEEKIYVPEMIFGHLLTGSNYDDDEKRVTGGRNGYGAKLTNIYSKEFQIETHDVVEGKTYKQKWTDNMTKCYPAKISKPSKKGDYTKVTFKPDLEKLNMQSIDEDTVRVLKKRVYDLTGSLSGVKVFLNGERIKISSFKDYINTYLVNESEEKPKIIYERLSDRWEVAVALSDTGGFQQVSFVNSIATIKGGTHVTYITDQIVTHIKEILEKKSAGISVKPAQIKNQLFVFVNCLIENPTFEGQVKETMTLRPNKYGSTCVLPDAFLKKIIKLGIVESTLEMIHEKDLSKLKKTDGQKRSRLTGMTKLDDANEAGGRKGRQCTLFLVEGDSAKGFAVTGIDELEKGRDFYGAFPLRGKLLNVRDAPLKARLENTEIANLKQILGLKDGKHYDNVDELRYGRICILVDSDVDGSHIKGLILNWLETSFPSLLKIPGFVVDFVSPIVKCSNGNNVRLFYTLRDYQQWKESNNDGKGWEIKYFKGLGTSKPEDIRGYFAQLDKHMKKFREITNEDSEKLDLVFSKKRAGDRKTWLQQYNPIASSGVYEKLGKDLSIQDFVDREFIEFSMYDNVRSIPSVMDGLKPGQRKILHVAFRFNLRKDIKVAQLSGKVSELTEYRHGEDSLNATIVGMAQEFVGSNNLALLSPEGSFGTRLQGGKDHANARYIFTKLKNVTRRLFPSADDDVLTYLVEDGITIEPTYYVPIIPMVLVNGAEGIGSGYSTTVLSYNPVDLVDRMRKRTLGATTYEPLIPWYRGFKGTTTSTEPGKWVFTGTVTKSGETQLEITELPIHTWTETYKAFLEKLITQDIVKDYKEYHTYSTVHFSVKLTPHGLTSLEAGPGTPEENLIKNLKLTTLKHTTNMMLFSPQGPLRKYEDVEEILEEFYNERIRFYGIRKARLLEKLQDAINVAENRARFVRELIDETLILKNRKKTDIIKDLTNRGYLQKAGEDDYAYLLGMPFYSLTEEKIQQLHDEVIALKNKYEQIQRQSVEEMYRGDLSALDTALKEYDEEWIQIQTNKKRKATTGGKATTSKAKRAKITK